MANNVFKFCWRSYCPGLGRQIDNEHVRSLITERKRSLHNVYKLFSRFDKKDIRNGHLHSLNLAEFTVLVRLCNLHKTAGFSAMRTRKLFYDVQVCTQSRTRACKSG